MLNMARHAHGFHLMDTLIAFLIMGLLIVVSLPSVSGLTRSQTLRNEARELELFMRRLCIHSSQREKDITLTLRKTSYSAKEKGKYGAEIERHDLKPGVIIDLKGGKSRSIYFYSGGSAKPATITLNDQTGTCELTLSLRGRVRSSC